MQKLKIPAGVKCVAAVKYADAGQIAKKVQQGFKNLGWSTVQHFLKTAPFLPKICRHHFIGHLQTNKVETLLESDIELIHSVDSEKLLKKIDEIAGKKQKNQKILLQIKTDPEKTFGFDAEEIKKRLPEFQKLQNVKIEGLMTIPPLANDAEKNRAIFRAMKKLANELRLPNTQKELSMGMSDDYKIAIEEGATMVRLGRILFSEKKKPREERDH